MAINNRTVRATFIRFATLGLLLSVLWSRFPEDHIATTLIGVAFVFEQLIDDALLRLLPWSVVGSTAAFYSMQLAYNLDRILHGYSVPHDSFFTLYSVGFIVCRSIGNLGSLFFLIGRFHLGSRAFAFITFVSFGVGSIAYYGRQRSTAGAQDLYYQYSFPSAGCSVGTILATVLLITWVSFRQSGPPCLERNEPSRAPE